MTALSLSASLVLPLGAAAGEVLGLNFGGDMTEQDPARGDEPVARLIHAARDLIDAYERKSTANEHFLNLEAALDALNDSRPRARPDPGPETPPIAE
jgi:hypothetical protein